TQRFRRLDLLTLGAALVLRVFGAFMSDLYPMLLVPEFKERVWGTRDLRPFYTQVVSHEPIGEAWLTGDECTIANGPFKGRKLGELCSEFGESFVGKAAPVKERFPLLI